MKVLVRINGEIREDTEVTIDSEMGLFIMDRGSTNIVRVKDKGVFVEVNVYGLFEMKDRENDGQ